MPTVISHALLPLIASRAPGKGHMSSRLVAAGMIAAILPDADVVGFRLGIPYGAELGHRGASHSLLFALLCGFAALVGAKWLKAGRLSSFGFVSLSVASHGLTDMLTNGGRGVALWWPISSERLFWPLRPVEVSSIGVKALLDGSLARVLASEFLWLLMPVALTVILCRMLGAPRIDLAGGQS